MPQNWIRFLTLRLPLMLVLVVGLVELAAFSLRDAPLLRHPLDRLMIDLQGPAVDAPVLLLGDSVTQDVAGSYALAPSGQLANLTTNQASALVGTYFILQRYLDRNAAPRHILIASTPELFAIDPNGPALDSYLRSVFTRPAEVAFISRIGLQPSGIAWKPAILTFDTRVFDRMVGLLSATPRPLLDGGADPATVPQPDDRGSDQDSGVSFEGRIKNVLTLADSAALSIGNICQLAVEGGAQLHIAWAPAANPVVQTWRDAAAIPQLQQQIRDAGEGACAGVDFTDFNELRAFPTIAFRDQDHLQRPGWTAVYARMIAQEIASFR